jgi:hypothetical protein
MRPGTSCLGIYNSLSLDLMYPLGCAVSELCLYSFYFLLGLFFLGRFLLGLFLPHLVQAGIAYLAVKGKSCLP